MNSAKKKISRKEPVFNTSKLSEDGLPSEAELSSSKTNQKLSKTKRRILKHVWAIRIALLGIVVLAVYLLVVGLRLVLIQTGTMQYVDLLSDFVLTPESKIEEVEGKTNILLLGKGGVGHTAPDLTDTIMVITIDHTENTITSVSLPRDIWVPELRAKLNSAYYWGNKKQDGGGVPLAKSAIETITGFPIQYAVVVDFAAFEAVLDELEGINVDVENSFVDNHYPIKGKENDECEGDPLYLCRYETIKFEKGVQYMDSATALKYVRSRYAEGDEGTDFARAKRQQQVIKGIKDKVLSREFLSSPKRIRSLIQIVRSHVETDMDPSAGAILSRHVVEARDSVHSYTLPEGFLINPPLEDQYDNLYVFIPNNEGNSQIDNPWESVNKWFMCIRGNNSDCDTLIPQTEE